MKEGKKEGRKELMRTQKEGKKGIKVFYEERVSVKKGREVGILNGKKERKKIRRKRIRKEKEGRKREVEFHKKRTHPTILPISAK